MSRPSGLYHWRHIYPTVKSTPLSPRSTVRGFTQSTPAFSKHEEPRSSNQEPRDARQSFPKYIRPFVLPNTMRGFVAEWFARAYWKKVFENDNGRKPTSQEKPVTETPLLLLIDDRPAAKSVMIFPLGLRFSSRNEVGNYLWNVAHRVPWSKRFPWMRWPALFLVSYFIFIGYTVLLDLERVPISGRLQFSIKSRRPQLDQDASIAQSLENMKSV